MAMFILNENTSFERLIGVVFNNWSALKMAVKHGRGGSIEVMQCKIDDLIKNIHEFLCTSDDSMCWTAIADIIEDVMDVGFNSVLEDTSADDLSKHIYKLYCEWKIPEKRESVLNRLKNLPMPTPLQVEKIMYDSSSEESASSTDDEFVPC